VPAILRAGAHLHVEMRPDRDAGHPHGPDHISGLELAAYGHLHSVEVAVEDIDRYFVQRPRQPHQDEVAVEGELRAEGAQLVAACVHDLAIRHRQHRRGHGIADVDPGVQRVAPAAGAAVGKGIGGGQLALRAEGPRQPQVRGRQFFGGQHARAGPRSRGRPSRNRNWLCLARQRGHATDGQPERSEQHQCSRTRFPKPK